MCNLHGDELEAGNTTWTLSADGKLRVGIGQRDLNEYVLTEKPTAEVGGGVNYLAQPDPFGVHLHLNVQQRGNESESSAMTLVVPVRLLRNLTQQLQSMAERLEGFEDL